MDAYEPDLYDDWLEQQRLDHEAITPHWAEQEAAHVDDEDPFDCLHGETPYTGSGVRGAKKDRLHQPPFEPWADASGVAAADSAIDLWFEHIRY